MIETSDLRKTFPTQIAVDGITLHIAAGEIFGLVGPDGAGKTTFMRMLCNLIEPDSGDIRLMGVPPARAEKSAYGYMPQKFSLYGDLTVMENIMFFASLYGLKTALIESRAEEILSVTGLSDFKTRLADQLSGGMKQKLALTCSLITRPGLLILDEPTYGVDPESRQEFWKILYELNQQSISILLSTPYMDEAELCHRVALLNRGKVIALDSPANLKKPYNNRIYEIRAASRDPFFFDSLGGVLASSFYGYKHTLLMDRTGYPDEYFMAYAHSFSVSLRSVAQVKPNMEDVYSFAAEGRV